LAPSKSPTRRKIRVTAVTKARGRHGPGGIHPYIASAFSHRIPHHNIDRLAPPRAAAADSEQTMATTNVIVFDQRVGIPGVPTVPAPIPNSQVIFTDQWTPLDRLVSDIAAIAKARGRLGVLRLMCKA
jgi:hypothetical protein